MGTFYKRAKWSMKNALAIFYRKVRIEGMDKIPRDKPLLIVSNHQNALLDPLLVGSFFPFPIHFLTRADVFNKRSRPYLKKLNMMPIYRIRDGFKSLSANDAVFEKCKEVFGKAESIMIFPEGNHGKHHYLRPLTKGAARLALSSQLAIQKELLILPVGVNYFDHRTPRSTVFIKYGEPFAVQSFLEEYEENNAKGLQVLRDRMSEEMKK
ncbi:MAG: lysophospholipid acyltransferase family protein, partial [Bacteroidota bacterium]